MENACYIVESNARLASPQVSITSARVVEISNELIYSEVLVDSKGRIPIFNIIDKRSEKQKKGIILLERKQYYPIKEYLLQKEDRPSGYGLNINGKIFVLRHRIVSRPLNRIWYEEETIHSIESPRQKKRPQDIPKEARIYPSTENDEVLKIWSTIKKETNATEITTRIVNTKEKILYILSVRGSKIENGIEKDISIVILTETITSETLLQAITKYNTYICTGLKEVAGKIEKKEEETSHFLKEMQMGMPLLTSQPFFFDLIYHILLEHRILLISQDTDIIVNYTQGILASLLPYEWKGLLFVPIPPHSEYIKLIETTIPYIFGIKGTRSEIKYLEKNIPEMTILAFLDEDKIVINAKTKEKKSLFNRMQKNLINRRALPFYQQIVKKMDFTWPILKIEMSILMEVISTQMSTAREKLIKEIVQKEEKESLRALVNATKDYSEDLLKYVTHGKTFFKDFIGTALYQTGIRNEYIKEIKDESMLPVEIATVLWLSFYASGALLKHPESLEEVKFAIEAYVTKYVSENFFTAEVLVVNLFSIFTSLNKYSLVLFICTILSSLGVQLTAEMCNAMVPCIPEEKLEKISLGKCLLSPWNTNRRPTTDKIQSSQVEEYKGQRSTLPKEREGVDKEEVSEEEIRSLWNTLSFLGTNLLNTLTKYVCVPEGQIRSVSEEQTIQMLLRTLDQFELPYRRGLEEKITQLDKI
ncbi:hypothetical protein NEOKW01_1872 [Nematocida sp. AWRm80]|nr:hypothetical protein NEOKW01_1872 [Nematocida sp. AWRm80]